MNELENKEIIEQTGSINSIAYEGNIKIALFDGDYEMDRRYCKNHGTVNLFKYLAECLCGNSMSSASAEAYKPCKLVLFNKRVGEEVGKFEKEYWTADERVSLPMYFDGAVYRDDIKDRSGVVVGQLARFHFRVPFLYLENGAEIYKLGLYPKDIQYCSALNLGNICAYHMLTKTSGTSVTWDPIKIPTSGGNFTIVVD